MKKFLSSILIAIPLLLVSTGLLFGQTAATATWALSSDQTVTVSGNVNSASETITGLQSAYETPPAGTTNKVQKLKPDATTSGTSGTGSWPTETVPNAGRYVEFTIAPQGSNNLTVDSIAMMIGNKGILGMSANIYYSTNSDFSDSTQITQIDTVIENTVMDTTFGGLNIPVNFGKTLYVRVYPYLPVSSTSTSKYLYVGNVVVYGNTVSAFTATPISKWGLTSQGKYWPISNDASTPAGEGTIQGSGPINGSGWATIQGGFDQTMQVKMDTAIVVTGQVLFTGTSGAGSSYTPLRYAIAYQDSSTLNNALTDSAMWAGKNGYTGYELDPVSGSGTMANASGSGSGTVWTVNNSNWNSTYAGGKPYSTVVQQPYQAELVPGTYNFAFSITEVNDTTNELRWYLIKTDNKYWFGGTVMVPANTNKINAVCFGLNGGDFTQFNVSNAQVQYGSPITVPTAPWEAYYVKQWGLTSQGHYWPITNDSSTIIGNGTIKGSAPINGSGWATIQGGFGQALSVPTQPDSALLVTGQLVFTGTSGAGSAYTPIRYALTYQDSSTLNNALTDSAMWAGKNGYTGYEFDPVSGSGTMANASGSGSGTVWTVNNSNWNSTYAGGKPYSTVVQQPYQAELVPGTYNYAFSVTQVNDTTNQVNWYLIKTDNKYWFGGTVMVPANTNKFNAVCFGLNGGDFTQLDVINTQVDYGKPITVPKAPWEAYYVKQWGLTTQAHYWPITNDSSTIIGNGTIKGSAPINGSGWASIQGGFGQALTVPVSTDSALLVTGQLVFTGTSGAGSAYTPLRYAIAYQDSSTLDNALTDSAMWAGKNGYTGYEFDPVSGSGSMANASGSGSGTIWTINNGNWNSTYANGKPYSMVTQQPYQAELVPGTYNFAFSINQVNDTTNELRWYLIEKDNKYWFGGTVMVPANTNKFNAICFGLNSGDFTQLDVINTQVDYGKVLTVPKAPWQAYYVKQWGLTTQAHYWPITNDSSTIIGNGTIKGSAPINGGGWASIQGGFGQPLTVPVSTDSALLVTGQLVFTGTSGAGSSYTPLRYAIAYQDSSTLNNALTDSAMWAGKNGYTGYEFDPVSGSGSMANASGSGSGTIWTINNGNWNSTYANGKPYSMVTQQPYQAELVPGTYNFAFSINQVNDTTNELRWYLIEKDNKYWFGGTVMVPANTNKFNAICFGLNGGDFTQLDVINTQVDYGKVLVVPSAPWQNFFVSKWGFYQNQTGGWLFNPGGLVGNTGMSGSSALTGWAALRGGFGTSVVARNGTDSALVIKGDLELDGGGFESTGSLRFGLYYNDNPGNLTVISDTVNNVVYDSTRWTGSNAAESGYLFIPVSGSNNPVNWGTTPGTFGSVINGAWDSTTTGYVLGNNPTVPASAVGGAGNYSFSISVAPAGNGKQIVAYELKKSDQSYMISGATLDDHNPLPTSKFNGIVFALGPGNNTTALKLTNVEVTLDTPLVVTAVANNDNNSLPKTYDLSQNYPNPFNPSTTIKFALPKSGDVSLVVYDILGREVTTLVHGNLAAGYHTVDFNASNLASGVYFYRLKAGSFVSIKKLMLLK